MKLLLCTALLVLTGCTNLISQAPSFIPSLERCQTVSYQRNGQTASLTLANCTMPTGELAK